MNSKEQLKQNIETSINLIIDNQACFNLVMGFNLKENKLVLVDKDAMKFSIVDLEEINKNVLEVIISNKL